MQRLSYSAATLFLFPVWIPKFTTLIALSSGENGAESQIHWDYYVVYYSVCSYPVVVSDMYSVVLSSNQRPVCWYELVIFTILLGDTIGTYGRSSKDTPD